MWAIKTLWRDLTRRTFETRVQKDLSNKVTKKNKLEKKNSRVEKSECLFRRPYVPDAIHIWRTRNAFWDIKDLREEKSCRGEVPLSGVRGQESELDWKIFSEILMKTNICPIWGDDGSGETQGDRDVRMVHSGIWSSCWGSSLPDTWVYWRRWRRCIRSWWRNRGRWRTAPAHKHPA